MLNQMKSAEIDAADGGLGLKEAYLDNSATTMVCREAAEKAAYMMTACYGNPSSLHTAGFAAEREMEAARKTVAGLLGVRPDTIVFTSGGTEANNLALLGGAAARLRAGRHVVSTAVEHPSVAQALGELERQGFEVERLRPDGTGMITAGQVAAACREDTVLVSVMLVNNETGARFPLEEIVPCVRRRSPRALVHCDAVQAAGKLPLRASDLDVDLMSVSAHKLHGPKGCGALYIKKGVRLLPRVFGGGQERGLRSGTEATPLIAAFGSAVAALPPFEEQQAHYDRLLGRLTQGLAVMKDVRLHRPAAAVPYIVSLSVPGIRSETMLHFLAQRGVYVSSGSACSKGKKSEVLTAMGLPAGEIDSALRVSLSRYNTGEDIDRLLDGLREAAARLVRSTRHS